MIAFMDTLRREQGRNPAALELFLSSHPAPAERAARLRQSLKGGGTRDSAAFRRIKSRLRGLPAARAMPRR
jgi:predicted Zn-dependent protease